MQNYRLIVYVSLQVMCDIILPGLGCPVIFPMPQIYRDHNHFFFFFYVRIVFRVPIINLTCNRKLLRAQNVRCNMSAIWRIQKYF